MTNPMPFARSNQCCANDGGNKFDLDTLDDNYFARLRSTAGSLPGSRYVAVMLFEGFSGADADTTGYWRGFYGSPYNPVNNVRNSGGEGTDSWSVHARTSGYI